MKFVLVGLAFSAMAFTLATTEAFAKGSWKQVENKENCAVWTEEPASEETVTWTGGCKDGKANGNGKKVWRYYYFPKWKGTYRGWKESTYIGEMRGGKNNGRGVLTWPDGSKYDGEWKNNKREGKGTWITVEGEKCDGIWRDNKLVSSGTTRHSDSSLSCAVTNGKVISSL